MARFGLTIRIGVVTMHELHELNASVRIAKYHVNEGYDQAVFLGDGLYVAERLVKDGDEFQIKKHDKIT